VTVLQLRRFAHWPVKKPAEQTAEQKERQGRDENLTIILKFVIKLLSVCLALWVLFTFVFGICQVSGESMYPSLRDGDLILYYRLEQDYQIDDVVIYEMDGNFYVGRIVAQGGDAVELSDDGQLLVNGNVESQEVFFSTERSEDGIYFPYYLPDGCYFILGDFRSNSYDSRDFGLVPQSNLSGKVITLLRRRGF
jgi:signal peptidase I